jgi:VWFA-related protein
MIVLGVVVAAQQAQPPVFRGSTDVVMANVQVTSRDGAAVEGLTVADFALKVDGKPRPIATIEFQRLDDARPASSAAANSTLSMGTTATAQSFVLIVADPFMMRPESSRLLFDQAADFVAKLPPAHAVGLALLPTRRPQFTFSENRQPIVAALKRQLGALGVNTRPTSADTMASMSGIEAAIDTLRAVDGRRTMVFLSDALPGGDRTDTVNQLMMDILRRAADAGIVIHTITTAPPAFSDAARRTGAPAPNADRGMLALLSDQTGGLFIERGSNGSIVLPQIARLLAAQYVMSFNVEPADKDGKSHKIDVKVNRKDVDVRFRKEFAR